MQYGRDNEMTDDLGLSPEFLADEDVARDEDNYDGPYGGGKCTCGYRAAMHECRYGDDPVQPECFAGCSGCDPIMHDCKPYGWGIEEFEDQALSQANEEMNRRWFGGPYRAFSWSEMITYGAWHQERNRLWKSRSKWSVRRARHSDIVWERICCEVRTHREAVERYARWADRAITVRYRDEEK